MSKQEYESKWLTSEDKRLMSSLNKMSTNTIKNAMEEYEEAQQKCRERLERMKTIVLSVSDLLNKYIEYGPAVKDDTYVILRSPLPAEYISRYIFDCNSLGLKAVIDSTGECFYNATH